jgi:anti-sigma B factor antagonist
MSFEVTSAAKDGTVTVFVRGEIDMTSAQEFRRALDDAPAADRLVVDLTGVGFLDSAGVKVLYDHLDRRPELVVGAGAFINRILTITGLTDVLTVRET